MRAGGRLWPALGWVVLAGCGQGRAGATASASTTASVIASATTTAIATTTATTSTTASTSATAEEGILRTSAIEGLVAQRGPGVRRGVFELRLAGEGRRMGTAEPALLAAPTAYRAPLAFSLLARELGMRVVPPAVVRAVPVAELGAALGEGAKALLGELRVQNDGTVDVLLAARSSPSAGSPWEAPRGTPFDPSEERETAAWARWAASSQPAAGEDGALLRDYLEMLVLDYLTANVARRTAVRAGSALVLVDNASAFPARVDGPSLDKMLRRLRAVARFPRGLRDALARFDRARAEATFHEGGFEGWLLAPRTLVELDERRAALLTLIEARLAERGAASVLSL